MEYSRLAALLAACCLWTITATEHINTVAIDKRLVSSDESQNLSQRNIPQFTLRNNLRHLAVGDFDRFNELFDNAKISIPGSFDVSEDVAFATLDMTIKDIVCYDITVGDASMSHVRNSNQDIDVMVNVTQLAVNCNLAYNYRYGILKGTGDAVVTTSGSSMSTTISFASSNFDVSPPSTSNVQSCVTNLEITNIAFSGDFVSNIVEIFERFIRNTIESKIEELACQELNSLGTSFVVDMLELAGDTLGKYEGTFGPNVTDPLYLEKTYELPPSLVALDLLDTENIIGQWFNQALEQVDKLLSTVVPDPNSPTGTGQDLGINRMIRNALLDENRTLVIALEQLPVDGVLFQGSDKLTETTITLQQVKILGLDSITFVNPMQGIGQYTLKTDMQWRKVTLEFDVLVDIRPSTSDDSILEGATSDGIKENISIDFGLENMNLSTSLFLVVDQEALGAMEVGSLLNTEYIMPCLLSTLHTMKLSGLHVDPQSIIVPTLTGFVSPGLDRLITDAVDAVFEMYKGSLESTLPNIFQTSIRNFFNREVFDGFLSNDNIFGCPSVNDVGGYIDFRDLLLSPADALAQGGSGKEPYGNLAYTAMDFLRDEVLSVNSNGTLKLNSLLGPFTKTQSGTVGTLQFQKDLISLNKTTFANKFIRSFVNRLQVGLSNLRITNLDTLMPPVSILETTSSPYILKNNITMGPIEGRPIGMSVQLTLILEGETTSPLEMENVVELGLSIDSASLAANILAKIDANKFLHFPLKDILLPQCWLATMPKPALDENGQRLSSSDVALALQDVALTLSSLALDATFIKTSSLGTAAMSDILSNFTSSTSGELLLSRMNQFVQELVDGDSLQNLADQSVADAPKACPHSPEYDKSSSSSDSIDFQFPTLSPLTVDSMFYAAAAIAQTAWLVYVESERQVTRDPTSTLSGQNAVTDPESLMDWTNITGRVGSIVDRAILEATQYLGSPRDNGVLGINSLIQDWLFDGDSMLVWEFDDLSFDLPGIEMSLSAVKLDGLDSFTQFDVWKPIAPQTLMTTVAMEKLGVELTLDVLDKKTKEKRQNMTLGLSVADISADIAVFLAMNKDNLGMLPLGSFMNMANILPCLLSSMDTMEITQIDLSIGTVDNPKVAGLMPDSQQALNDFVTEVMDMYRSHVLSTIPIIVNYRIRNLLNGIAKTYLSTDPCPLVAAPSSESEFIDFVALFGSEGNEYGDIPPLLKNLLDSELLALNSQTGRPKINEVLIAPLTEEQSGKEGSLVFQGDLFGGSRRVRVGGLDANVELRASDARIENLDTIGTPLEILAPVLNSPYMLNNTATFGLLERPLNFGLRFLLSLTGDDNMKLRNDLDISLDLSQATIALLAMLKISTSSFFEFPVRDLFNLDCWLATIPAPELNAQGIRLSGVKPTASVADLVTAIADLNLNITCVECTSPKMAELADLLTSRNAQDVAKETATRILDYFQHLITGDFLQIQLDRALNDASKRCPHSPNYDPDFVSTAYDTSVLSTDDDSTTLLVLVGGVVLGLCVVLGIAAFSVRWFVRRRHRKWLLTRAEEQVAIIAQRQKERDGREAQLDSDTQSMFTSSDVPVFVRWFMPLVILGNIGFFLSGHLSLGATVNIVAEFAGQEIVVEKFFEFSMAQSTLDIWNAGGHALAILILIFSGIWPYTKQFLTLALWFLPPSRCSTSRRGAILLWLDYLAKWSIIDIFVLVISLAAFRVSIESPDVAFLPDNFYSINLLVVPLWGLYANMIAQLLSQVSSHFIVHYHRHILHMWQTRNLNKDAPDSLESTANPSKTGLDVGSSEIIATDSEGRSDVLYKHRFGRPHRGEDEKLVIRGWVNKFLIAASVCLTLFVLLGCILPSFSLNILGLVGIAVESGQRFEDAKTQHNIFTVVKLLFEEARFLGSFGDWVGLITLSLLFLFSVLIVPLVQCAVLLRQWFGASTQRQRSRLAIVIETLQAWQYAEVYLIAIFVASWQLGPISEFMINSYCDSLNETFAQWVFFGIIKAEDGQCFSIESSIESGSYILAIGAVVLGFVNSFINKAAIQYFRDMEERAPLDLEQNSDTELSTDDMVTMTKEIRPVPVLFTDNFRWFLQGTESTSASISVDEGNTFHKATSRTLMVEDVSNNFSFGDESRSVGMEATDPSETFGNNQDAADVMVHNTYDAWSVGTEAIDPSKIFGNNQDAADVMVHNTYDAWSVGLETTDPSEIFDDDEDGTDEMVHNTYDAWSVGMEATDPSEIFDDDEDGADHMVHNKKSETK